MQIFLFLSSIMIGKEIFAMLVFIMKIKLPISTNKVELCGDSKDSPGLVMLTPYAGFLSANNFLVLWVSCVPP